MKINSREFRRPAILLGNGLNNHLEMNGSWFDLLNTISSKRVDKEYFDGELSYPEFFDAISFQNGKGTIEYESFKKNICKNISLWRSLPGHQKLTQFARMNNIPILTTNYDFTLVDHTIAKAMNFKHVDNQHLFLPRKIPNSSFTHYYPWHSYYSDSEIVNARTQFAIWHIHGIACYERSLSIGAIDYGNNVSRYKNFIGNKKDINTSNWKGINSWLDVFLHCDLIIIGLNLRSEETSLRWLLMEREKYFRSEYGQRMKTLFITNKQYDKLSDGKKFFFDSINIKYRELSSGKEIYDSWEYVKSKNK